jgi:hypothetical protein
MGNAFDSANYPEKEPTQLVIGDRWLWKRTDLGSDYPPASYSLKYSLRLHSTGTEIEITANESGNDYLVEVASATTAGYTAGFYAWQAYIIRTSDSERVRIGSGTVEVLANRDSATGDPRTHARIVLDAIEAVIESRATKDQEEYSINGRSLKRTPLDALVKLRTHYRAEVNAEVAREHGTGSRKLLMRF